MPDYTIKALVVAEPISTREIEAGTVALTLMQNKYYRITLTHITADGDWVVEGDYSGIVRKGRDLLRLTAVSINRHFPIAIKDWKKIIKAGLLKDGTSVKFIVKPHGFKEGTHTQVCSECAAHFTARKSQPFCVDCCELLAVAVLGDDIKPIQKIQQKKELSLEKIRSLLTEAYDLGTRTRYLFMSVYMDAMCLRPIKVLPTPIEISTPAISKFPMAAKAAVWILSLVFMLLILISL